MHSSSILRTASFQGFAFLFFAFFVVLDAPGQQTTAASSPGSLFETEDALVLTLKTDLPALLKDRGDERDEHPASIAYTASDSSVVTQDLKVRVRGNFRRQSSNCSFPPLRLNFSKEGGKGTIFEGQDKLKLVVPCQMKSGLYENYILLEYLVYRIYNQLTDLSFKVRLVEMTFEDISGKRDPLTNYGFLVEDEEAMAVRNGGEILDQQGFHPEAMDKNQATLLSMFQYMIGNTDWYISALHNIKLVKVGYYAFPYPVPYDFDHAGLVNARYALPHADLPIERVTQRYYKGYCRTQEELELQIALFNEKKEAIHALLEDFAPLSGRYRRRALQYLDEFYSLLDNPRRVRRVFMTQCQRND